MRKFLRSPIGISLLLSLALCLPWLGFGDIVAHLYWNTVFRGGRELAPRSIVVLSMDDLPVLGTREQAEVLAKVRRYMPRTVFFDTKVPFGINHSDDAKLVSAIDSFGDDIAFVARADQMGRFEADAFHFPSKDLARKHKIVVSAWNDNFMHVAEYGPYSVTLGGRVYQSTAAALAGLRDAPRAGSIYPDYWVDPNSIQTIAAADLMAGKIDPTALSGKTVVVSASGQGSLVRYFGRGVVRPIAYDIAGAAALEKPIMWNITFIPLFGIVVCLVVFGHRAPSRLRKALYYGVAVMITLAQPAILRNAGIISDPSASLLFIITFSAIRGWQKRIRRVQHTSVSGLPNLLAMSSASLGIGSDVVVAVVARYEEILATLPRELHGECANQIARRLSVGSGASQIYHGDGGHFAWCEEARPIDVQLNHLHGLRALFSAPLQIGTHTFDTNIHFGLDRNEGLDALTRINSALASANEALTNGRPVEVFEAHRLAEAPWELSLHARIDEGLRNGDIWLAFQPQWDYRTGRISGAEALIRWNHPTRGFIAPDAFILQAERAGRIDALTYWVLEEAITAAQAVNALGQRFQMSINLSGQMVDKPDLVENFREIVTRRGIDPGLLTIEITETSGMNNRVDAVRNMSRLRDLGFRLSIDDFGTGEASLAYLADLPSDELKIDRRFVSRLLSSDRDRAIITSTIGLAHALGQAVVAEGIEDEATFNLLAALGCDHAQGYYLSKPQLFDVMFRDYQARLMRHSKAV